MSKTYCRYCDIKVAGLYINCPRCGNYLPPDGPGPKTAPEPCQVVEFGKSWDLAVLPAATEVQS